MGDLPAAIKCVRLAVNGKTDEITVDMRPEANEICKRLGGEAAFVGMYRAVDVIIMKLRSPKKGEKKNKSKLPAPFDTEEVQGPMILVKMVEGTPQNFTLDQVFAHCHK